MDAWCSGRAMRANAVVVTLVVLLLSVGCASAQPDETEMFPLASALTKLARAVDGYVAYTQPLPTDSTALIEAATAHNPTLREPFTPYSLSVKVDGRNSAVLVCSADRTRALLEDTGCTAEMDRHAWRESPVAACVPVLNLATLCRR